MYYNKLKVKDHLKELEYGSQLLIFDSDKHLLLFTIWDNPRTPECLTDAFNQLCEREVYATDNGVSFWYSPDKPTLRIFLQ